MRHGLFLLSICEPATSLSLLWQGIGGALASLLLPTTLYGVLAFWGVVSCRYLWGFEVVVWGISFL